MDATQRDGHLHVRQLLVPRLQWREITVRRLGFFSITFPLGILSLAVRPVVGKVVRGYLLPPFAAYF